MPSNDLRSIFTSGERTGSANYLRRARRLRHRLRHNPARLHACLRELSQEFHCTSVSPRSPVTRSTLPWQADPLAVSAFADQVAAALDGVVLRYSNRLALLDQAARMGISRFEANLIIATVQHRLEITPPPPTTTRSCWPMVIVAVIGLQALIVLTVWRLFGA